MSDDAQLSRRNLLRAGAVLAGVSAAVAQKGIDVNDAEPGLIPSGGGGGGSTDSTSTLSVYGDGSYDDGTYGYS